MKTKHFLNAVMVARIVVIFSVLSGCVSTVKGGAQPDPTAAQSAAPVAVDLVPALGGKAKVEGGTVTLTDTVILTVYVRLQTALTVPEGVTLDLTANGAALELQDGAVLTVNGTVNATGHGDHGDGWVEGSLRMDDGRAVIAGTGTVYLKNKGRLLNIGSDKAFRQLVLDGVTLVGLPDNDSSLVGIYENSELIMKNGAITGNTYNSNDWAGGGGAEVNNGGKFTMEGGAISGNSASGKDGAGGGGVQIGEESVFTMLGGTISGNSAREGGGVRVWQGTFTMEGGRIQGSTASDGFAANQSAALSVDTGGGPATAKWGTGGTYTKGGVSQTGGGNIGSTDDTLIAEPAR